MQTTINTAEGTIICNLDRVIDSSSSNEFYPSKLQGM